MRSGYIGILSLVGMGLMLTSCDQARRGLGLDRSEPDEFTVCDRPPLSMPPTIDLRPPVSQRSGEAEEKVMRKKAEKLVLKTQDSSRNPSAAEAKLLQKANAGQRQSNIREIVNGEAKAAQPEEELVQKILFWQKPKPEGDVIDPVKEKAKLIQQETEAVPLAP